MFGSLVSRSTETYQARSPFNHGTVPKVQVGDLSRKNNNPIHESSRSLHIDHPVANWRKMRHLQRRTRSACWANPRSLPRNETKDPNRPTMATLRHGCILEQRSRERHIRAKKHKMIPLKMAGRELKCRTAMLNGAPGSETNGGGRWVCLTHRNVR